MNPYRHMLTKVKTLLISENKLSIEEKKQNEWIVTVSFHGTKITVGKGGITTCFYQFGPNGKRGVCYPDEICERLERLGKRRHLLFQVKVKTGVVSSYFTTKLALTTVPSELRSTIVGITESGKEEILYTCHKDIHGLHWYDNIEKVRVD